MYLKDIVQTPEGCECEVEELNSVGNVKGYILKKECSICKEIREKVQLDAQKEIEEREKETRRQEVLRRIADEKMAEYL